MYMTFCNNIWNTINNDGSSVYQMYKQVIHTPSSVRSLSQAMINPFVQPEFVASQKLRITFLEYRHYSKLPEKFCIIQGKHASSDSGAISITILVLWSVARTRDALSPGGLRKIVGEYGVYVFTGGKFRVTSV